MHLLIDAWVSLVVDYIACVADVVVASQAPKQVAKQVRRQGGRLGRLPVVVAQHRLGRLRLKTFHFRYGGQLISSQSAHGRNLYTPYILINYRFDEMVMWDLREKMVDDMSPDVMVDVVEPSVVPVKRCQASAKVAPFLIINNSHIPIQYL
jgi:hypothetical protein